MKLSFSIPAYNEEEHIGRCLASIQRDAGDRARDIEVVVVNNGSTDRTQAVAESFRHVRVVFEPQKGLLFARQRGYREVKGDLVANIDADTILTPGWIEKVFRAFERSPRLVALSGPYVYYDLSWWSRFLTKLFYLFGFLLHVTSKLLGRGGTELQGGNFVVRKSALDAIGGFNTKIQFYGEDTDLARRISRVGTVRFSFRLTMLASGRRLKQEGVFMTGSRYAINHFWVLFFGRPFTTHAKDIRPETPHEKSS